MVSYGQRMYPRCGDSLHRVNQTIGLHGNYRERRWMIEGVTLGQLRAFVAAVDEGSFSAAGRRLGRTQSVVTQTIANLEKTARPQAVRSDGPKACDCRSCREPACRCATDCQRRAPAGGSSPEPCKRPGVGAIGRCRRHVPGGKRDARRGRLREGVPSHGASP